MARPIWKGALSFGMVSIPVRLSKATEEQTLHFNMLHSTDHSRLKQQRLCAAEGTTVESGDVVKGYEVSPGEYVILTDEDFESVAIESTRTIEIQEFVPLESIDPIYFDNSYFLEPEAVGKKPYVLLRQALADGRRVGMAHLTMAQKEYLCAIRLYGDTMMLNTLRYESEVRAAPAIPSLDEVNITEKEIAMARSLVDALSEDFDPSKYHDRYRDGLLALIEQKQEGQTVSAKPPTATKGAAMDLMAAMRASVDAARKRSREAAAGKTASAKQAAAQKADATPTARTMGRKAGSLAPAAEPVAITARRTRKAG